MKPASLLAPIVLSLIALAHLARLVFRLDVTLEGRHVPLWLSGVAFLVLGTLAVLLVREQRRS